LYTWLSSATLYSPCHQTALEVFLANQNGHWKLESRSTLPKLESEIKERQSVVLLDPDGTLKRQVALTVLRVEDASEFDMPLFVEVAHYNPEEHCWIPSCRFPGIKQFFGESPSQALQRCIDTRFKSCSQALKSASHTWDFDSSLEVHQSAKYGVGTTYHKNTCTLPCTDDFANILSQHSVYIAPESSKSNALMSSTKSPAGLGLVGVKSLGVGRALTFLPRPSNAPDNIQSQLHSMTEVYLLKGSQQVGIYAWLPESTMKAVAVRGALLQEWLERIESCLPADAGEHEVATLPAPSEMTSPDRSFPRKYTEEAGGSEDEASETSSI